MNDHDPDERFKIEGDPEEALRGLLAIDPEQIDAQAKADALQRLRCAASRGERAGD
jgi:hypothetical protein